MHKTVDVLNMCSVRAPGLDEMLLANFRVHRVISGPLPSEARDARALVPGASGANAELIAQLPKLEIIANVGVGYDHIDVAYAATRGIVVTNTPDVLTDDVADLAIALIVMISRKLVVADRLIRSGGWKSKDPIFGSPLKEKRLGILGLGRIGMAIAVRATAMGMYVAYHNRRQIEVPYPFVSDLVTLARESDFLLVAASAQPSTRHIVDREVLEALGPAGILINIARGSLVDEAALVDTLQKGDLGGAGLDVFEHEPIVPATLLKMENVVLTPHVGSATIEARSAMANIAFNNLMAHFSGRPLLTEVPESRAGRQL